jgi:hypothetical protein
MHARRLHLVDRGLGGQDNITLLELPAHLHIGGHQVRVPAMQAMALGRGAHVSEPARSEEPAAEGLDPCPPLELVQRGALAHRRDPGQRHSTEPRRSEVEPPVGEDPKVSPSRRPQIQCPAAVRGSAHDRGERGGGELVEVGLLPGGRVLAGPVRQDAMPERTGVPSLVLHGPFRSLQVTGGRSKASR